MRFRIFYCCDYEENGNPKRNRETIVEIQTKQPVTDQPTQAEVIPLERITGQPTNASNRINESVTETSNSLETSFTSPTTSNFATPASHLPSPTVRASANFNYVARNGERTQMSFDQVEPDYIRGTYKGSQFTIVNGKLRSTEGAYSQHDKELILKNHSQAKLAMQQGFIGVEASILQSLNQQLPPLSLRQLTDLTTPTGSNINVNYTAENGEKFKMVFKQIKPGLFRGICNDVKFSIANGQVLPLDGADCGLNKELILSSFYRALLGVQQTKLGMQQGEWAIETRLSGSQLNPMELLKAACPEMRASFETETLRMHNEFRKRHRVPPLVHSEFLCEMAREWAEHLALKDTSYHRPNNQYGENLYFSHGAGLDARKVVTTWYDEINLYDYNDPQFSKETGHFTQLVWRETREMGTGIAQLGDKVWVCCYYHPPGNVISKFSEKYIPPPVEDG